MPPPIGPPVLNRYNTSPLRASNTTKSPVSSPVSSRLPAVVVTAATIGRGERYFHFTAPVEASTAVTHPCALAGGSGSFRPPLYTSELQSHSDVVCRLLLENKITERV